MLAVRAKERQKLSGSSPRTAWSLLAVCTLALAFAATTPVQAQDPNDSATHTPLDDVVKDRLGDLRGEAIEFWFEHSTLDPTFIELGKSITLDRLEMQFHSEISA